MRLSRLFVAALVASFAFASSAQAVCLSNTPNTFDIGSTTSGSYNVSLCDGPGFVEDTLQGTLAAKTKIDITYSYSNLGPLTLGVTGYGSNNEGSKTLNLMGAFSDDGFSVTPPDVQVVGNALPILVTAGLSETTGTATIINNSKTSLLNFYSYFSSFITGGYGTLAVSYNVSSVPLPGALLLFGSGLTTLVGVARRKRR